MGDRGSMKRGDEESDVRKEVMVDTNRGGCFFFLVFRACFRFSVLCLGFPFFISI